MRRVIRPTGKIYTKATLGLLVPRRTLIKGIIGGAILLGSPFVAKRGRAAVITAATGNYTDVQNAINAAAAGDEVAIPAGTWSWAAKTATCTDDLYIHGAGKDLTTINQTALLAQWTGTFQVNCTHGRAFKFSDMTLAGNAGTGGNSTLRNTSKADTGLYVKGKAVDLQVFNARFQKFGYAGMIVRGSSGSVLGSPHGVIYQCEFLDNYGQTGYGVQVVGPNQANLESAYGWGTHFPLGGDNGIFIEDNTSQWNDVYSCTNNGIVTGRHNTQIGSFPNTSTFDMHGWGYGWGDGGRAHECYNNNLSLVAGCKGGPGGADQGANCGCSVRGGSVIAHDNTWVGCSKGLDLFIEDSSAGVPATALATPYPWKDQIGNPDPAYFWNNVAKDINGVTVSAYQIRGGVSYYPAGTDGNYWMANGRDYFPSAKSGYTPFTYPHPLRGSTPTIPVCIPG